MSKNEIEVIDLHLTKLCGIDADAYGQDVEGLYETLLWSLTETAACDLKGLLVKLQHFQRLYWPTAEPLNSSDVEGHLLMSVVNDLENLI